MALPLAQDGAKTPSSRNDRVSASYLTQGPSGPTTHCLHPDHKIGFVGLGGMGSLMCRNLTRWAQAEGLPPVTVWNRTASKTVP